MSGKTSCRLHFTRTRGCAGIDTDTLRTMMGVLSPRLSVGHTKSIMQNYQNMRPVVESFVHARSFFDEDYVLEGDCINIEDAAQLVRDGVARVVILGYPRDTVERRKELILNNSSPAHWLRRLSDDEIYSKISACIEYSKFLQDECRKYGVDFVDVSEEQQLSAIYDRASHILFGA